ncbi:MAG: OmpA family protein [Burkholderiaceae bacterium]|nr:OmpA family protein [Burkholderiaceae bacterium]
MDRIVLQGVCACIAAGCALLSFAVEASAEIRYDAVLLSRPNSRTGNITNKVNAGGIVVGDHGNWNGGTPDANGFTPYQPALYANGKLNPLTKTLGGTTISAYSINAAGHVVGCSANDRNVYHAFVYAAGRMQDLGTLQHEHSCANSINDRGEIVGTLSDAATTSSPASTRAFLFRNGKMNDLNNMIAQDGSLFDGQKYVLTDAPSINNQGDILLQARAADGQHATLIYSGGKLTMPDPSFQAAHHNFPAYAGKLTENREFASMEMDANHRITASYLYRAGHYEAIPAMSNGASFEAYDMNGKGVVVGSALSGTDGPQLSRSAAAAYIDDKVLDLNTLVDAGKLNLEGKRYVLRIATGVNDAGVIVGEAVPEGEPAAGATFVLTPRPPGAHLDAAAMGKALQDQGTVDIYDILFDSGKATVKPESRATMEQIAKLLKGDPALRLEVSGHTDNQGDAKRNLALSTSRAQAVVHALTSRYGINAARLQATGYGAGKPIAPNDSETGRAKNRRVELRKTN